MKAHLALGWAAFFLGVFSAVAIFWPPLSPLWIWPCLTFLVCALVGFGCFETKRPGPVYTIVVLSGILALLALLGNIVSGQESRLTMALATGGSMLVALFGLWLFPAAKGVAETNQARWDRLNTRNPDDSAGPGNPRNRTAPSGLLLAAFGSILVAGCADIPAEPDASPDSVATLRSATSVSVYEGLPHQAREHDLLEQEKQRDDIVTIGEYPFYTPAVAANQDQAEKLKQLLGAPGDYYIYKGEPPDCGPFHPDFAVEWKDGKATRQILVCFGCSEIRVLPEGPNTNWTFRKFTELKPVLLEFSGKRPGNELKIGR